MEQSLVDSFKQATVITVTDKERIKNLVANFRFAKISFNPIGDNVARIVFTTSKKDKPDQIMAYQINGADLTPDQISLLSRRSL
jgi:Tol biopolymer transport system component